MGMTMTYFRLSPADRERLGSNEAAWREFQLRSIRARTQAMKSALDSIPSDLSREERIKRLNSAIEKARDPRRFDLEKDWHTIAYLLTEKSQIIDKNLKGEPLHNLIFGGIELPVQTGYGSLRYFDGPLIEETVTALKAVDRKVLIQRFNPGRMAELQIYAAPVAEERDSILKVIDDLMAFFAAAAAAKEQILRAMT
jgi:hypothetical protein